MISQFIQAPPHAWRGLAAIVAAAAPLAALILTRAAGETERRGGAEPAQLGPRFWLAPLLISAGLAALLFYVTLKSA